MLRRIVDLREGEGRTLAATSAILALVTGAHTILETARDTLFLSKLPPSRLAWVYVLLAALSLVAGAVSSAISKRFGRRAGFVVTLGICAYTIVLLYLREPTPATVFILYVASGVIGTILTLQFWLFAGQLFTVSQGKRLFGPLAAGGVLGATLGATLAAVMLRWTSVSSLLFSGAALFIGAGLIVTFVPTVEGIDDEDLSPVQAFSWLRDASLLKSDRYVALIGGLVAVSTATVLVADYLFKSTAVATLGPAKLGPFLGAYYAVQNALALVVQLFVTGPLIRRLGVTTTLLLFPLLVGAGGVGVIATGAFGAALAVKGADGSLRHSLHRVSTELLLLPLPSEIRDRAKRLIDTMLGRGSQAVAAGAIVGLSAFGAADPRTLGAIVVGLSLLWVGAALALRAPYLDVFRRALARGELPDGEQALDLSAVETILESLASDDENQVLAAIDVLASSRRRRLLPALILYHESPAVLERALGVFSAEPRRDFVPLAERLLGHADPAVRGAAVRALAASGNRGAAEMALSDADPNVRAVAVFFLAWGAEAPERDRRVEAVLSAEGDDGSQERRGLLAAIGAHGDERWAPVVRAGVRAESARRSLGAAGAAAVRRTREASLAGYLVEELKIRESRGAFRDALLALGDPGFEALERALLDPTVPEVIKRQVPRAIASFGSQVAVDLLLDRLGSEPSPSVRHRIVKALGRLSTDAKTGLVGRLKFDRARFERLAEDALKEHLALGELVVALAAQEPAAERPSAPPEGSPGPDLVIDLLSELLRDRMAKSLERAFRFIQLAHRNEDLESVHYAVVRGDKRARSTALEFLDVLTMGDDALRTLLRLVVDDLPPKERALRAREILAHGADALGHDEALTRLIRDEDPLLAALSVAHAAEAGLLELVRLARQEAKRRPELLRLGPPELLPARLTLSHA
jgi:AAA family ATP:ADP antiporter